MTGILPQTLSAGQFKKPIYYKVNSSLPYSIVTADFNGDGNMDLAVSDLGFNQVSIFLGKGDGTLDSARNFSLPGCAGIAVGDFNGDHIPDLAIVEYAGFGTGALGIYLGKGDGTFHKSHSYAVGPGPVWIALADFNGDGFLDAAVTDYGSDSKGTDANIAVLLGKGDGTFGSPVKYKMSASPVAVTAGDLNGDRKPDLVVSLRSGLVLVLLNTGDKFVKKGTYTIGGPEGIAIADFDKNGTQDLAVASVEGVNILLGKGNGTFASPELYSTQKIGQDAWDLAINDFNGDGALDVAAVTVEGNLALLYGKGDGRFRAAIPIKIKTGGGNSLTFGDFNNDGRPDLAAPVSQINKVVVLLNSQ